MKFLKLTVAEIIALFSAFSLTLAISRFLGYFLILDIQMIGLIDMSDVLTSAFYVSPFLIIPIIIVFLTVKFSEPKSKEERHEEIIKNLVEEAVENILNGRPAIRKRFIPVWLIHVLVVVFAIIVVALGITAFIYSLDMFYAIIGIYGGVAIVVMWRVQWIGKHELDNAYLAAVGLIVLSFGYGVQEGQKAINEPDPTHRILVDGSELDVFISKITHSHVFLTDSENRFRSLPVSSVQRLEVLKPLAIRLTDF